MLQSRKRGCLARFASIQSDELGNYTRQHGEGAVFCPDGNQRWSGRGTTGENLHGYQVFRFLAKDSFGISERCVASGCLNNRVLRHRDAAQVFTAETSGKTVD